MLGLNQIFFTILGLQLVLRIAAALELIFEFQETMRAPEVHFSVELIMQVQPQLALPHPTMVTL
jgi:hypothetical protein